MNPKTRETVCLVGDELSDAVIAVGKWPAFGAEPKKDSPERWPGARIAPGPFQHTIRSAVVSPDLKRIAIATEDDGAGRSQTLRLFEITTGGMLEVTEVASVKTPHKSAVVSSRFSPDGRTLALGSMDCSVSLWDVARAGKDWKPRATIPAGRFTVSCLAFSPDGRTLAAGTYDSRAANLFVIDARGGKLVASRTVGGQITAVAYSPDGNLLATGAIDAKTGVCRVRVWDAAAVRGD